MDRLMAQYPAWLHWLDECPSTNSWAIAQPLLTHGDVVFTPRQTAGRGQQGRIWHSPTGVCTASFVLQMPVTHLTGMGLAAGLAVIEAIESLLPELQGELGLKWPNDVWLQGRKLAGILCECAMTSSAASGRVIVGIGLNRCADFSGEPTDWAERVISLHQVAIPPDELSLLIQLRQGLLATADILQLQGIAALLPKLRQRDVLLGKGMTVENSGERVTGAAAGIGDRGELRLRLADGTQREFVSGHVVVE